MLRLALACEARMLLRSRAVTLALVAFLAVGALAIFVGQRYVAQWEHALVTAQHAQMQSIAEAREFLARGEPGPADRAWVNLAQPLWQDWYAGTRARREPGALAGIASGAVDPAPAAFRISRLADPLAAGGYRIENPELTAGAVDLVFVLGLLLPLLVAALGLTIGSREREAQLDRLIRVQAGTEQPWLVARMLAVTLIAAGAAAALCIAAALTGGASAGETAALIGIALVYTALWSGLLLLINAQARTVRGAAFAFGVVWTLLCVLLPTMSAELALGRVQADYALADTLDARGLRYEAYEQELTDVLPVLYTRYPELADAPAAADDPLDPLVARHAYDALVFAAVEARHAGRREQEAAASRIAEAGAWVSPAVALALALERLAGVGPEAASAYRDHLINGVRDRVRWVVDRAWAKTPLAADDFEALVARAPTAFRATRRTLAMPVLALLAWALAGWTLALVGLARAEQHDSVS